MRKAGVLGIYTDSISEESQKRIAPILKKLYKNVCDSRLTKNEAKWIGFMLNDCVSRAINESEKYELFKPIGE